MAEVYNTLDIASSSFLRGFSLCGWRGDGLRSALRGDRCGGLGYGSWLYRLGGFAKR